MEPLSQLVTVVVPTFERSAELARALDSLLAQDHPDLEIIVGDNASADDTEAVVPGLRGAPSVDQLPAPGHERRPDAELRVAEDCRHRRLLHVPR